MADSGTIVHRAPPLLRPRVQLPIGLRGAQPIFDYLMAIAERTQNSVDHEVEILEKIEIHLAKLRNIAEGNVAEISGGHL